MNCPNCDNDLMVRLEPQGAMRFLRFLPMESYYCVKCGKRVTRLSGPSSNPALGVALMVLVLAGMALAVWRNAGDREAAKPAPQVVAQAPAAANETRGAVVQVPVPPAQTAEAPAPEAPTASPPPAPAPAPSPAAPAKPAPAAPAAKPAAPAPVQAAKPAAPAQAPAAKPAPPVKATAEASGLRTISAVTAAVTGGATKVTVVAGSAIEGFTAFPLAGPPRFVVDLTGRFAYRGASTIPVSGGSLTSIRVGSYPDKVRLVLDYAKPGPDGRPAKPPTVTPTPQGLVINAE
jgi:outer membrane biosynthesis protein TonB